MAASDRRGDPLLARASPGGWAAWLRALGERGDADLAAFGLTLAVGFAAGLLALYLFAALAYEVMRQQTDLLDLGVLAWLQQFKSPALDALAWAVSLMGSQAVAVLVVVLGVVYALRGRWGAAVGLVLVTGGAQLLNDVLKGEFHRVRPAPVLGMIPVQAFSFPSGHAMVSAAFYGFLAYLSWRVLRGWWRTASTLALLALVLAIGLSRLYLGVHYLTDVLAGYLAGFVWADTVILGSRLLARRRAPPPPPDRVAG
ncbi:MAG TPA: phosphatase PAP2 family protein [Chloroflexota bacterium]|nr:phosphatase PAP2 family protein [Chloroflexota bacterium]